MQEFKYTKSSYYSEVNDFEDSYHKEEDLDMADELLIAVRKLKRKYRDFDEWCDAMWLYKEYCYRLIDAYGGKKRFRLWYQLGWVKEYIPLKPELRRIKRNRPYIKEGMYRQAPKCEATKVPPYILDTSKMYVNVKFRMKCKEDLDIQDLGLKDMDTVSLISDELDMIDSFYMRKRTKPVRLSHKKQRKQILAERYKEARKKDSHDCFTYKYKQYVKKKLLGDYVEDRVDPTVMRYYKDISLTQAELDEIEVIDYLKSIGVSLKRKQLSKKATKIIRRQQFDTSRGKKKKGKKGKKHKKGNRKVRSSYMKKFMNGKYHTFAQFEDEMLSLTESDLGGIGGI